MAIKTIHRGDGGDVDLNLLRVLVAIAHEGSVTRAGQRLGLSQPAVSNALARLRRSLGDPLFVRTNQGMEATPRARRAMEALEVAMGLIRQGLRGSAEFNPLSARDEFSLLVSDLGELVYLPPLMRYLEAQAPGVQLRVRQLARSGYAQALEAGIADLAVGYLADPRGSLRSRPLFADHFVCMVRPGHPVLDKPFTVERYLSLSHVLVSRRSGREGLVTAALAAQGVQRRVALVIPHFASASGVVACSDLAVTVPSRLVGIAASARLVGLALPFPTPTIRLAMFWHGRLHEDPAHRWLRGVFLGLFGKARHLPAPISSRGPAAISLG